MQEKNTSLVWSIDSEARVSTIYFGVFWSQGFQRWDSSPVDGTARCQLAN